MSDGQTERKNGRIVTTYLPIFRDKLAKLEWCGLGHSEEAQKLRRTLAFAEATSPSSEAEVQHHQLPVVAE